MYSEEMRAGVEAIQGRHEERRHLGMPMDEDIDYLLRVLFANGWHVHDDGSHENCDCYNGGWDSAISWFRAGLTDSLVIDTSKGDFRTAANTAAAPTLPDHLRPR